MNNDRVLPLLQRTTLLLSLMAGSFLLTACGGSDGKSSVSSSSSVSSRSSYVAASVPANGSGVWPSVKVGAQNPKQLTFQWSAVEGATFYRLFKHDALNGGITQVGVDLTTTQATDEIGVHVHDWVNNYYYVEACNNDGCQKSDLNFTATEMIKAIGYLKSSNSDTFDNFGWSLALSADGQTLAVGATGEDSTAKGVNGDQSNNDSTNAGAVYVFVKQDGAWVQQAYLKASNTEQPNLNLNRFLTNDRFGYKVALSDDGNTLAVSALLEDSPSYGVNCNQDNYEQTDGTNFKAQDYNVGAVYVFTRTAAEWSQEAYIKPLYGINHRLVQGVDSLGFGESLALSGDGKTLAIGASSDVLSFSSVMNFHDSSLSSNPADIACQEYYPSSMPSLSSSTSSSSSSSSSVSSSASSGYAGGPRSGAVYVFVKTDELGWKEESLIKASNAEVGDAFGGSIAISQDGNTLAVGAIGEDSGAVGVNGEQLNGCYYDAATNESPAVNIIIAPASECGQIDNSRQFRGLLDNGAAYIFSRENKLWTQQAYLKPGTAYWATRFGYAVDLSADGNLVAIGAPGDASGFTGVNGDATQSPTHMNTGAAYIFKRSGTAWTQEAIVKPSTLPPPGAVSRVIETNRGQGRLTVTNGSDFGTSLSLSRDGSTLAVGAPRESSNAKGINGDQGDTSLVGAGAVFVFKLDNNVWSQKSYVKPGNPDQNDRFGASIGLSGDGNTMAVGAHRESGRGFASSSAANSELDQNDNSLEASGAVYLF
jgi:hypothetical protein